MLIDVQVLLDTEREEGVNVSKDLLAEPIVDLLYGNTLDVDGHDVEVEAFEFVGSGKGKPMEFKLKLKAEEDFDLDELSDTLEEEVESLLENEGVNVQSALSDTDSWYSVTNVLANVAEWETEHA